MTIRNILSAATLSVFAFTATPSIAGEADVLDVRAERSGDSWRFTVTVAHEDAGWNHYADRWDILAPDGTVLGSRVLLHPHDSEQPFTRSLGGVAIPAGIDRVTIRAHDKIHGLGGKTVTITLPE
ncbi:MAG: hypothetical protein RJQ21_12855 [Rhodospirillales bacterium]